MRKTAIAGAVVVIGGILGAGVPYATGLWAERIVRDNMRALTDHPQAEVRLTGYQRGWLRSHAESEVTVTPFETPFTFRLRHKIEHGPRPSVKGLARVTTTPRIPEGQIDIVSHYFGDRPPLKSVMRVGLLGDQHARLFSPAVNKPLHTDSETRLDWGGLRGRIDFSRDRKRVQYHIDAPRFRIQGPDGDFLLKGTRVDSDMHKEKGIWLGKARVAVERLQLDTPAGEGQARLRFLVEGIKGDHRVTVGQTPDLLRIDTGWTFQRARVRDRIFRKGELALTASRIDRGAYRDLQDRLTELQGKDLGQEELTRRTAEVFQQLLPRFLARSPRVRLEPVRLETPEGGLEGKAKADYRADPNGTPPDLAAALRNLSAQGRLEMDKDLLVAVLEAAAARRLRNEPGLTSEQVEQKATQVARTRLALLEGMGILVSEDERYSVEASWRQGRAKVNGRSLGKGLLPGSR